MHKLITVWALAAVLGAAVLAGCGAKKGAEAGAEEPAAPPNVAAPAPEAGGEETPAGEALVQNRCTTCHNLNRVSGERETREGWEDIVDEMIEKGAKLDGGEREAVIDYLAATYGK